MHWKNKPDKKLKPQSCWTNCRLSQAKNVSGDSTLFCFVSFNASAVKVASLPFTGRCYDLLKHQWPKSTCGVQRDLFSPLSVGILQNIGQPWRGCFSEGSSVVCIHALCVRLNCPPGGEVKGKMLPWHQSNLSHSYCFYSPLLSRSGADLHLIYCEKWMECGPAWSRGH